MKKILFSTLLAVAIVAGSMGSAHAYKSYLDAFNPKYGTNFDCGLCHNSTGGGGARNAYGTAFGANANHASNPAAAFDAIASSPSACSGYTNLAMISQGLYPGGHGTSISCPTTATPCNSYTYTLGACQSNNTAPVTGYVGVPAGCSGGATPATSQPCTYVPPTTPCTSYNYTLGACQSNNTAPVTSYVGVPTGCSGGATPATSQPCTYTPPATDGATLYQNNCQGCHQPLASSAVKGKTAKQISDAISAVPDMSGLKSLTPAQIQAIAGALASSNQPLACTSYTYTLGACQPDNTAPVTGYVGVPSGCSGGPTPATSQPCSYTPPTTPPPAPEAIPLPAGEHFFTYDPVESPMLGMDPATIKPIGVGSVVNKHGDTINITIGLNQFAGPVDVSFGIYAPAIDSMDVYFLDSAYSLQPTSKALIEADDESSQDKTASGESDPEKTKKRAKKHLVWKTSVKDVNEPLLSNVPVSALPKGKYVLSLEVTPSSGNGEDSAESFYRWITHFEVR